MAENNDSLPKAVKINGSNRHLLTNALHARLNVELYDRVEAVDRTKTHVPDNLMNEWLASIQLEIEINRAVAASALTARMAEKDAARDRLFVYAAGVVRAQALSPVADIREAAEELLPIVKTYKGLQDEAFDVETLHGVGLRADLSSHAGAVDKLGLTDVFNQFYQANDEYADLRVQRRNEAVASNLPPASEVRPRTDAACDLVSRHIEASYLFATADADRQAIIDLVAGMNRTIAEFKTAYRESQAQKKKKKTSQGEENNQGGKTDQGGEGDPNIGGPQL